MRPGSLRVPDKGLKKREYEKDEQPFKNYYSDWISDNDHHVLCAGMVYLPGCPAISRRVVYADLAI